MVLQDCNSKRDVLDKLNVPQNGRNNKLLGSIIEKNNLNISHFDLSVKKRKYKIITKICPICGNSFDTKEGHKSEKITCSHSCANTYFRSGENNPNYKDISEYSNKRNRNLSKKYRKKCFEYHEHKCCVCGENKILDVHHYDENKFNNEPENLIPICPTHHGYYHSKYRSEVEDKIKNYYKWFKNKIGGDV